MEIYLRSADLAGTDEQLTKSRTSQLPLAWADGGKVLVFQEYSSDTGTDIGVVPIEGERLPRILIRGPADEERPSLSMDGRWIAYQSNLSGRWEVYVQPFPELDGRWQVSTEGGVSPVWHPNGRELFYRNARSMMSVPIQVSGRTFTHGNARMLFEGSFVPESLDPNEARSYALSPDGARFLMMRDDTPPPGAGGPQIVVIMNWSEELKRLLHEQH
jgi:Tol biopolymer transport system component